jgi:hypothetical protein
MKASFWEGLQSFDNVYFGSIFTPEMVLPNASPLKNRIVSRLVPFKGPEREKLPE